jgi:REP element-mobilizing transposase RayT
MTRPLRIEYPGAFYHITSRGIERRDLFRSRSDRFKFLSYLESATERYGAVIHVYCLMGNHYHLLLETPRGNLSQIMHHVNGAYTTYFNVKNERVGHLLQGRYKSILVEADAYALELSRYIHLNPVRSGIAYDPIRFPWSSSGAYAGVRIAPAWLSRDFILSYFSGNVKERHVAYRRFVERGVDSHLENPLSCAVAATILGKEAFVEKIKSEHLCNRAPDEEVPALKIAKNRMSIRKIVETVHLGFGVGTKEAKRAGIYFCRRFSGESLREIGLHFDMRESAVSKTSQRFSRMLALDENLKGRVQRVEALLEMSDVQT